MPAGAERVVSDADSVVYFWTPVAGTGDSALVHVFYFTIGPRTGAIQVQYRDCQRWGVEGADWLPAASWRIERKRGLKRCSAGSHDPVT